MKNSRQSSGKLLEKSGEERGREGKWLTLLTIENHQRFVREMKRSHLDVQKNPVGNSVERWKRRDCMWEGRKWWLERLAMKAES